MSTFINQADFASLNTGDQLLGKEKSVYEIETARCGGAGAYPTHMVSTDMNGGKDHPLIFHDGVSIRYSSRGEEHDGNIVGELSDKNFEAFGEIKLRV